MINKEDIFIPPWLWGIDHNRLLVFLEHIAVDESSCLDSSDQRLSSKFGGGSETRLNGGQVSGHDDWDCLNDLQAWGFVNVEESDMSKKDLRVELTGRGWRRAHILRRLKAKR